jgi:hypothetical protein
LIGVTDEQHMTQARQPVPDRGHPAAIEVGRADQYGGIPELEPLPYGLRPEGREQWREHTAVLQRAQGRDVQLRNPAPPTPMTWRCWRSTAMRTVPVRRRWPFGAGLELDSLDFEALVVQLSERSGHRIDEDDYPQLTTVGSCVDYLASRAP